MLLSTLRHRAAASRSAFAACAAALLLLGTAASAQAVSGTVRDRDGRPLAGVNVYLGVGDEVTTDANGHYTSPSGPGSYNTRITGFGAASDAAVPRGLFQVYGLLTFGSAETDLTIIARALDVTVVDPDGQPVPGAKLTTVTSNALHTTVSGRRVASGGSQDRAVTDASGVARVWVFDADDAQSSVGAVGITAEPPAGRQLPVTVVTRTGNLSEGDEAMTLQVPRGFVLDGVVRDRNGVPVPGVKLTAWDPRALARTGNRQLAPDSANITTGPDGAYSLLLAPGHYRTDLMADGLSGLALPAQLSTGIEHDVAASRTADIRIDGSTIDVLHLDAAGLPVTDETVRASGVGEDLDLFGTQGATQWSTAGVSDAAGRSRLWTLKQPAIGWRVLDPGDDYGTPEGAIVLGPSRIAVGLAGVSASAPPGTDAAVTVFDHLESYNPRAFSTGRPPAPFVGVAPGATRPQRTITLTNFYGSQRFGPLPPLEVSAVTLAGADAGTFSIEDDGCTGHALEPGGSCTVTVEFKAGTEGQRAAELHIAFAGDDAPASPSIALAGEGYVPPTDVDETAPTITLRTPPEGAVYDQGDRIVADFVCDDEPGGSGLEVCEGTVDSGQPIETDQTGPQTFTVTAVDGAGNRSTKTARYTVRDVIAPAITIVTPSADQVVGRGDVVTANYLCADEAGGSGVVSCSGPVATGRPVTTTPVGVRTFTVTAVDAAGNTASKRVSYTVVDRTAPTITILAPTAGQVVAQGSSLTANYRCADETGGSGLATCAGPVATGRPLNTTSLGARTVTVTATDRAGNRATRTASYTVVDRTLPTVTITRPTGRYAYGAVVNVSYSCGDNAGGSGIASCTGPVTSGARLNTRVTRGATQRFVVTAVDRAGNRFSRTATWSVQ